MSVATVAAANQLDSGTFTPALFAGTDPNTQMVWLNKAVWSGEPRRSMIGCYGPATIDTAFQFGINTSTNFSVWRWGGIPLINVANATLPTNQWIHFVYRWTGTNSQLMVNNVVVDTTTEVPQSSNITQTWVNGFPTGGASETVGDYLVSDYRLYNRLLSFDEITTIYNLRGKDHINFGLVGHWVFNEGNPNAAVSVIRDISPNGNDMTPVTTAMEYRDNVLQVRRDYITNY